MILSIKKIDTILKDNDYIKFLENIYNIKITSKFTIKKRVESVYKNGSFKNINNTKMYTITASTNKGFNLLVNKSAFEADYKRYKERKIKDVKNYHKKTKK